jgi:hypothetical protein
MAQFANLPEIVIYSEFGVEHKAFPIAARELEHHAGENAEPLLSLVFVKPVLDPLTHEPVNVAGTSREGDLVHIVHDVPHESHAFSEDQLKAIAKTGVNTVQAYPGGQMPGGRWRELDTPVAVSPTPIPIPVAVPQDHPTPEAGEEPPPTVQ